MMIGIEFKELLKEHNLTVNQFLDLRDIWNGLAAFDKYELLKEEINKDANLSSNDE